MLQDLQNVYNSMHAAIKPLYSNSSLGGALRISSLRSVDRVSAIMGFTLTTLFEAMLLFLNALAVLHEERFLKKVCLLAKAM